MRTTCCGLIVLGLVLSLGGSPVEASTLYVNNRRGFDSTNGRSSLSLSRTRGPLRTISRALAIAGRGDTIVIANTGVAYRESLHLFGSRHSGTRLAAFRILGNGATVSGARPVPGYAWRRVGGTLWRFAPYRKGHYLLLRGGRRLTEHSITTLPRSPRSVPAGEWSHYHGSIYYRVESTRDVPAELPLSFAARTTGISLYAVRNIEIRDLVVEHFRVDGVGVADMCREVLLENLTCRENARAGLAVAGTSDVRIVTSKLLDNRRHSLLVTGLAGADLDRTVVSQPPTIRD